MRKVFSWLFLVFIWSWVQMLVDAYEQTKTDWAARSGWKAMDKKE